MSAVEPLQEGEEVTDTTGKKWKLVKLLSQSTKELIYEGETWYMTSGPRNVLFHHHYSVISDDKRSANTFTVKYLKADTAVIKDM